MKLIFNLLLAVCLSACALSPNTPQKDLIKDVQKRKSTIVIDGELKLQYHTKGEYYVMDFITIGENYITFNKRASELITIHIRYAGEKGQGIMWECPDFFPLDCKWVLILSPIEMERQQEKYWNLNSTVAFIGDMNWETGQFFVDTYDEIDGGLDFYAPQTCQGPNGERYMVAWMQMWQRSIPSHDLGHGWAGSMTIPRKLGLKDGRLVQELPESVKNHFLVENAPETIVKGKQIMIPARGKQTLFEIDSKSGRSFILKYGDESDVDSALQLIYDASNKRFSLSRDQFGHLISGKESPEFQSRWIQLNGEKDYHFSILRDTNSIEVFVDGKTLSMTFYETTENPVYTFKADEGVDLVVKAYQK